MDISYVQIVPNTEKFSHNWTVHKKSFSFNICIFIDKIGTSFWEMIWLWSKSVLTLKLA